MARIRDDTGLNARQRFLRWLLEGDDALDQALADGLDAPPPRPLPPPRAVPVPAAPDPGQRRRERASRWLYVCIALLLCVGIMGILLRTAADLPAFGLSFEEVEAELIPENYTGRSEKQVTEFIESTVRPLLEKEKVKAEAADLKV